MSIYGFARLLKACWRLISIVLKVKPDILHANSFYSAAPSMVAAIVTRKKLFIHARDLVNFGFFTRVCGYFGTRIIAVSHCVKDTQVKNGVSPGRITVVYNGVKNHFFSTEPQSMDASRHNRNIFVFANVGQFVPWKNQTLFLKAASVVGSRCAEARFVLVGDDVFDSERAYKQTLFDYAANSNVSDRIAFWGWRENMSEVWPKIDCLVHTADREPFGRVIIEAMAYRISVIAMNSCGPKEIIDDRKTGILVDADDFEGLVQAMLTVARDRQFANRLAESGYERTVSSFTFKLALMLLGGYALFSAAIIGKRSLGILYNLATVAVIITVTYCLIGRFRTDSEAFGFHGSALKYGTYIGILAPLSSVYLLASPKVWQVLLGGFVLAAAVVSSGTLGALAAISTGTLTAMIALSRRTVRLCIAGSLALGFGGSVLMYAVNPSSRILDDLKLAESDEVNLRQRYIEWQAEINLLRERTVTGTGAGCINDHRSNFYYRLPKLNTLKAFDQNGWLAVGAETGIVGLLCFSWIVLYYGKAALARVIDCGYEDSHKGQRFAAAGLAGIAAACVANLFSSVHFNGILIAFVLVLALISGANFMRKGIKC